MKIKLLQKCLTYFAVLFSCIYFSGAQAENSAAGAKLQSLLNGMRTLQGNFTQTVYNSKGKVIRNISGYMTVQRPGLFRWETKSPTQQTVIANGNKVWIYDQDLKQVRVKPSGGKNNPAVFLSGSAKSVLREFSVQDEGGNNFILKSRFKSNPFNVVKLNFSGKQLQGMELSDNLGQRSVLRFSGVKTNAPVSKSFNFTPPKGADVVRD